MTRTLAVLIVSVLGASAGCRAKSNQRTEPAGPPPSARASAPSGSVSASASASAESAAALLPGPGVPSDDIEPDVSPDFGDPGFAAIQPAVPPFERGMMDHAERFGWTPDSKEFGYCWEDGGLGGFHCTFSALAGKAEELIDFERGSGEIDPKKTAALRARIAKHAVAPAHWPYAQDLLIVWEATKPASDAAPEAAFQPELRVGARVRAASAAALPIRIRSREPYGTIHPEAIVLSPDGKRLAVLSHAFWGEFSDTFELRLFAASDLASQAYNAAGLELHERGEHARAAVFFHRAAHANPSSKLPMYNLACAFARLGDPRARKALELAIARGGPEVRAKALRDPDFERVRRSPWFTELVP